MKRRFNLTIPILTIILVTSCKKDVVVKPDVVFTKPYSTGIIKFQYQSTTFMYGIPATKDTTVGFTSRGSNSSESDDFGYNQPSIPWAQVMRLNPENYSNSTGIFFAGTDLSSLTLPYTFQPGNISHYAFINYVLGYVSNTDSSGSTYITANTYLGSTTFDNFELTILSKKDNRLQGTFSGSIKNQDGDLIEVKNGLFDIEIVDK